MECIVVIMEQVNWDTSLGLVDMVRNKDSRVLTQLNENENYENEDLFPKLVAPQAAPRKYRLIYRMIMLYLYWHIVALHGIYLAFTSTKWPTLLLCLVTYLITQIGITAGSHRLWAHKTYKAKLPLQIILMVFTSIACQGSVIHWARDHRMHHKYSDTDADPHNSTRGFFYSHLGWLLVKKHPEVAQRGKYVPIDDLDNNPVLKFQKKYAVPIMGTACFIIPTLIPVFFWEEKILNAWHTTILRYVITLNATFLVNSLAHMVGYKPYDNNIPATQNIIIALSACGEGFHNYHHTFPWDYRAAELGNNRLNLTTKFIDFFAWIGWAYDLKTVPKEMVENRAKRTGDGKDLWGRVDKDITRREKENTE